MPKRKTGKQAPNPHPQLIADEFDSSLPASHHFPELLWDKDMWIDLLNCMPSQQLSAGWLVMAIEFYKVHQGKSWNKIDASKINRYTASLTKWTKEQSALIAFSVLHNKEIFHDLLNFLPPDVQLVFTSLIWKSTKSGDVLENEIKEKYPHRTLESSLMSGIFNVEVASYQHHRDYDQLNLRDTQLSLPVSLRRICINYLPKPKGYYIEPLDEISFAGDEQIFSAESEIFDELPQLLVLYHQGKIKYGIHGKPHLTSVKQAAKRIGIKEFYTGKKDFPTRTHILVGLLHNFNSQETRVEEIIKVLLSTQFFWTHAHSHHIETLSPLYVLNHVKGMGSLTEADFDGQFNHYLLTLARELPVGKWVTAKNYLHHLQFNLVPVSPFKSFALGKLYVDVLDESFGRSLIVKQMIMEEGNVQLQMLLPYISGLIFVLAALGIFEIAYTPVDFTRPFNDEWFSEYDGLKAFRLTELGAYVLGLREDYKPRSRLTESHYFFESDTLLLRVEGELDLIGVILEPFLEQVAPNRFSFNSSKFLEGCDDARDISEKIKRFRSTLQIPLPALWEETLQTLLDRANHVNVCHEWTVCRINATDKTLQRLIAHDSLLKTIVLKAEEFYVLVKTKDIRRFKARLQELGYLFDQYQL